MPGIEARLQILWIGFVVLVEIGADLGGDGETGRHRQAEMRHLGKARALATEEIAHFGAAFGLAAAEAINPLAFFGGSLRGGLYDRLSCGLYDGLGGDFARRGNRLGRPRRTRLRGARAAHRGLAGFLDRLTGDFGTRFRHRTRLFPRNVKGGGAFLNADAGGECNAGI